jgi:hypothetical protein
VTSSSFHKDIHIFEDEEDDKEDDAYNDNKDEVQVEFDVQEHNKGPKSCGYVDDPQKLQALIWVWY